MVGHYLSFLIIRIGLRTEGSVGFQESPPNCFGGNSTRKEAPILGYLFSIEWKMVEGRIFEMISRICSGSEENKNADSTGMNE